MFAEESGELLEWGMSLGLTISRDHRDDRYDQFATKSTSDIIYFCDSNTLLEYTIFILLLCPFVGAQLSWLTS